MITQGVPNLMHAMIHVLGTPFFPRFQGLET